MNYIKLLFTLVVFLIAGVSVNAQSVIASDGFNSTTSPSTLFTSSTALYTYISPALPVAGSGPSVYNAGTASNSVPTALQPATNFQSEGSNSWGVNNGTTTFTTSNIDASDYNNIKMSFRLQAPSPAGSGVDGNDSVVVDVSTDGGATWNLNEISVSGDPTSTNNNRNARWAYSASGIATRTFGDLMTAPLFAYTTGGNLAFGYSTVELTGLPANTNLRFRITLTNTANTEYWIIDDFKVTGIINNATSIASGNWSSPTTWLNGKVPYPSSNVTIGHNVTIDNATFAIRDVGKQTTINSGAALYTGTTTFTNNGVVNVSGTFRIDYAAATLGTTGSFIYTNGTLAFNNGSAYAVSNTEQAWPATNSPLNVDVLLGGLTMNSANRTVAGTFTTAAPVVLNTTTLTLTGICQINTGGSFSQSPTFGNASTLIYNQGGAQAPSAEWNTGSTNPAAGTGAPQNITIQNSTTITLPAATRSIAGNLLISSGGLTLAGGDVYISGNWTRAFGATFSSAARVVYFTSAITQVITVTPSGTETFDTLAVQTNSQVQLATGTNVNITAVNGLRLTSTNATSNLDLNGQTVTLTGGGLISLSGGARKITSSIAGGSLVLSTSACTVGTGTGSLTTETNTIVKLATGLTMTSPLFINGTLQINSGGSCSSSPRYGSSSLLQYNSGATYTRSLEWNSDIATIGTTPGYPNNVQISNNTTLNYYNATYTGAKGMNGSLTIDSGSSLTFGATSTGGALTVLGNVTNAGSFTLGATAFVDDLKIGGNFSNTGTFNGNNRAIFFIKNGLPAQTIYSSTPLTIPYIQTGVNPTAVTTVQILNTSSSITISAPLGGNAIVFNNATDVFDLNGKSLTIGTTAVANAISGSGTFSGGTTSSLTLLGTGSIGTLSFSGLQSLDTFTMNRSATTIGCVMGTPLTVNASLVLTNGLIDLGTNNLTLGASATTSGSSNSYVLAFGTTGGQLIKTFNGAGSFTYPIGDNTSGLDYSPAILNLVGGTYGGTVGVRVVDAAHPSIGGATDYLTRYWQVTAAGVTPASYTFTGTYVAADIVGTESACMPACYNGSSWVDQSGTGASLNTCMVTGTAFPYSTNEFTAKTGSLYYRSKQTGFWNVASTWETSTNNVTWSNAVASPTNTAETITVLTGHTVTINASVTVDQVFVSGNLVASGNSIAVTINNGPGTDLTINNGSVVTMSIVGTLSTHGWIMSSGSSVSVLSGGSYIHNTARAVSSFLDQTTFDNNSTMTYLGSSSLVPAVSLTNRVFGHLRFESSSGALIIVVPSFTTTCTTNDFFNGPNVTLRTSSGTTGIFAVGGNFTNNGTMDNAAGFFNFTFSGTTKTISGTIVPNFDTVNFTGSYTLNTNIAFLYSTGLITVAVGGTLDNGGENQITGSASANVVVNGKFITKDAQGFTGTNAAIPTLIVTVNSGSTVEYGGPTQVITPFTTYYHVTISGTGTKTLSSSPIVMNGDLTVNSSTLLVNSNEVIDVKQKVTVAGGATFEIKNNGQLIQVDDIANGGGVYNGNNIGNIIYNRTASSIRGYDYVYWATPLVGQDISGIYTSPAQGDKYVWSPTVSNINTASTGTSGNWTVASGTMTPGSGFIVRGSSWYGMPATNINSVFTGVPCNGVISTPISRGNNIVASQTGANGATVTNFDDNWNLVGNPYPSSIKATEFLKSSNNPNIQGFINIWTHGTAPVSTTNPFYSSFAYNYTTSDYITYNAAGSSSGPSVFNGNIAAGQGFFVAMNDGASGSSTVTFNNSMRNRTYANNQFYRSSTTTQEVEEAHRIWLDLVDSDNNSLRTLIGYFPEATEGFDRMYDAQKNIDNASNIYSIVEDRTVIIQGRPTPFNINDRVPIGINIKTAGVYSIAIASLDGLFSQNQDIYLEDTLLNVIHDLRDTPYSFSTEIGKFEDRFVLRYTNETLSTPDFDILNNSVFVATSHGELTINSQIELIKDVIVFDVLGRQLFEANGINNNTFSTSNISMSQQALIVKITLDNGMIVTRKILL